MFSEREIVSLDTCSLSLPHNDYHREVITITAVTSDMRKRPVRFPPLFTIHTPRVGIVSSSGIFPWLNMFKVAMRLFVQLSVYILPEF